MSWSLVSQGEKQYRPTCAKVNSGHIPDLALWDVATLPPELQPHWVSRQQMNDCLDKESLTKAYLGALRQSGVAAGDLDIVRRRASREDYQRSFLLAQKTLRGANDALLELSKHTEQHGC